MGQRESIMDDGDSVRFQSNEGEVYMRLHDGEWYVHQKETIWIKKPSGVWFVRDGETWFMAEPSGFFKKRYVWKKKINNEILDVKPTYLEKERRMLNQCIFALSQKY